jgi:hypothetical protein
MVAQACDGDIWGHALGHPVTENADADIRRLALDPQIGMSWQEKWLCKRDVLRTRRAAIATDRDRKHYSQRVRRPDPTGYGERPLHIPLHAHPPATS